MSTHTKPRQVDRVLKALRAHPNGITESYFQPPVVYDGGKPVRRVAARVLELRLAGHDIRTHREPNGTARYQLHEPATDPNGQLRIATQEAA